MRRRRAPQRKLLPDPKFNDETLAKFMRVIMEDGKLSLAESIVYDAMDMIKEKSKADPLEYFGEALDKIKPMVEVKSRRVGGATYQVPIEVAPNRARAVAMRWLRDAARGRKEKTMAQRLANELMEAYEGRGSAMKKRENTHAMAEANKAFAHYRW